MHMSKHKPVDICTRLRSSMASLISITAATEAVSEKEFCQSLLINGLAKNPNVYPEGWYAPPPSGVAALFGRPDDNYERLKFDTLRKEQFWPRPDKLLAKEGGVGIIYASPVDIESGIIGDFGISVCIGCDKKITGHLANCLSVLETVAEQAQIGMEFRELYHFAQKLFTRNGLTNARTITWTDKVGTNIGHTVPWSYEEPDGLEQEIIQDKNFAKLSQIISEKRINLNRFEHFKIADDIAFTVEARLESLEDPLLPNVFYHMIVTYKNGKKKVLTNFNKVFDAFGMNGVRSRYQ